MHNGEDQATTAPAQARREVRAWLHPRYAAELASGRRPLPRPSCGEHSTVMVTVGPSWRDVAWIDEQMAPIIAACTVLSIGTVECCQGGPELAALDDDERPAIWLASGREARRFVHTMDRFGGPFPTAWTVRRAGRLTRHWEIRFPVRHLPRVGMALAAAAAELAARDHEEREWMPAGLAGLAALGHYSDRAVPPQPQRLRRQRGPAPRRRGPRARCEGRP